MDNWLQRRQEAKVAADDALWSRHPELKGRQLTLGPEDALLRREWMESYRQAMAWGQPGSGRDPLPEPGPPEAIVAECAKEPCNPDRTKIYLGYTVVIGSEHHTFVIAENSCSDEKFITRAGPSAKGPSQSSGASASSSSGGSLSASSGAGSSGGFGFGTIRAQYGKWSEALAFDRPSMTVKQQFVGAVDASYAQVIGRMVEFARITNENRIPYFPLGPNSNSYAFTFVESLGLGRPAPVLSAPGHDMGQPDDDLSYHP